MAIAKVADRGSAADTASSTTTSVTLAAGASITVGNYLILRIAYDNSGTSGANPGCTVSDARNGAWATPAGAVTVNDPGNANAGTCVAIRYVKVATGYSNGDAVTVTFGTAAPADSVVIEEWSGISATVPVGVAATAGIGTSGTPSIARTPTASGQMFYGCLAAEGSSTDSYTEDADTTDGSWVSLTKVGSNSGTATNDQTVTGAYKLVTGTTAQTWDPTITSRDWAATALVFNAAPPAGSPTVRTWAGNGSSGNVSSFSVPDNAAMQAGDLRLVCISISTGTVTTPAGWTAVTGSPFVWTTTRAHYWFYKTHSGSESSTSFTFSGASNAAYVQCGVRNFDTSTPFDVVASAADGSATGSSLAASAVTTVTANAVLLAAFSKAAVANTVTLSTPATMADVGEVVGDGTGGHALLVCQEDRPATGTTGTRTSTANDSTNPWGATMLAIHPASAGTNASAGNAAGTGVALDAAASVKPNAENAAGTGTALAAAAVTPPVPAPLVGTPPGRISPRGSWRPFIGDPTVRPAMATLTDDFATKDTAKWDYQGTADATGGQLVAGCLDTYANHVQSRAAYDLTGSYAAAKFVSTPALGNGTTEMYLQLSYVPGDNSNSLVFDIVGPNLVAKYKVAGTPTFPFSTTYNSTTHKYLRIREASGTIFWDYSPDGSSWTNAYSVANPIAVTALHAELGTGYGGVETSPGNAVFDDFNIFTPATNASAGNASGTGAALDATVKVSPSAGSAAGTGAAGDATTKAAPSAGNASGTGAAFTAAVSVKPSAGNAAGTGAVRDAYVAQFEWSGYSWSKRVGTGLGPGPNNWGATAANIRIDSNGYLVLEARQVDGVWTCAEVDRVGANLGYGRYQWTYDVDVANLDPKPVLGLFVYDQDAGSAPSQREIDIEVSKWGDDSETSTMSYAVHPVADGEWLSDVHAQSTVGPYTAEFVWEPGQVYFRTTDGNGALLGEHVVTQGVQVPGTEQPIMNLWLFGGAAPEDGLPITATIRSFAFTASATHTLAPAAAFVGTFDAPYQWATKFGASITGGELVLPCASTYSAAYSGSVLDLRSSSTQIEISQVPATGGNNSHETLWYLRYDDDNYLAIFIGGGNLIGRMRQAGSNTDQGFGAHNATTHRYWRIGVSGTTVTFSTSPDGSSWTTQWAPTTTLTSQRLKTLRMRLECGHYLTETSPGELHVTAFGAFPLPPPPLSAVPPGRVSPRGRWQPFVGDLTPAASTTATAGLATGTGTAYNAAVSVKPSAGLASGTGAALGAAPKVAPLSGVALSGTGWGAGGWGTSPYGGATTGPALNATVPALQIPSLYAPPPGRVSPRGRWRPWIGDLTPPAATSVAAGLASGTGAAFNAAVSVAPGAGLASGAGAAGASAPAVAPSAGAASGTGAANAPSVSVAPPAGSAAGTGAAGAAAVSAASPAGLASGTGTASDAAPKVAPSAGLASGTGAALDAAGSVKPNAEAAAGTGTALAAASAVTPPDLAPLFSTPPGRISPRGGWQPFVGDLTPPASSTATAGLASGTGAALDAAASVKPTAEAATGTGAAFGVAPKVAPGAEPAFGAGTANTPSASIAPPAGAATGAGTAGASAPAVAVSAGAASGTGAALGATCNVSPVVEAAAGTGTAYNAATVTPPEPAPLFSSPPGRISPRGQWRPWVGNVHMLVATAAAAEAASGTGSALNAAVSVKPTAAAGSGTGAANAPAPNVSAAGGLASGTGTAQAPAVKVSPVAQAAAGTGAAHAPSAGIQTPALAAVGTATAGAASSSVQPAAGAASGSGTAYDATAGGTSNTDAPAGVASGTGTAHQASVQTGSAVTAADQAGGTDTVSRSPLGFTRTAADQAGGTDTASAPVSRPRTASDNAGGTDSVGRTVSLARLVTDAAQASDEVLRGVLAFARTASDSAPATDFLDTAGASGSSFSRTASDSAYGVDSVGRVLGLSRTADDTTWWGGGGYGEPPYGGPAVDTAARGALLLARTAADLAGGTDTVRNAAPRQPWQVGGVVRLGDAHTATVTRAGDARVTSVVVRRGDAHTASAARAGDARVTSVVVRRGDAAVSSVRLH